MQGDTLTYTVTTSNVNSGGDFACDITNASVTVTLPAADGTPTGTVINIVTGQNYPAGSPVTDIGTIPYVVNVNPGVVDIVAEVRVTGTLHDAPADHAALIVKTIGTSVITAPVIVPPSSGGGSSGNVLAATASPLAVQAPRFPNTGLAKQQ